MFEKHTPAVPILYNLQIAALGSSKIEIYVTYFRTFENETGQYKIRLLHFI